jgi:hypothetical protein
MSENRHCQELKRAFNIDDVQLIKQALAVYWLLMSQSSDNIIRILRDDNTVASFALTPEADEFIRTQAEKL